MGLFWAKYARRIFAIVSTTSIPDLAPVSPRKPLWTHRPGGPDWMPITPKTGSLFHAYSHRKRLTSRRQRVPSPDVFYPVHSRHRGTQRTIPPISVTVCELLHTQRIAVLLRN